MVFQWACGAGAFITNPDYGVAGERKSTPPGSIHLLAGLLGKTPAKGDNGDASRLEKQPPLPPLSGGNSATSWWGLFLEAVACFNES